ncbi:hypothetical protein DK412_17185 [Methylobacterium sp. 17Sr1-1]|nr:hypothetical protein DK412_17185 [Methylobacterium sp. 17Sr1-1]
MSDGVIDSGRRPSFSRDDDAVRAGGVSIRRLREIESLLGVSIDPAAGAGPADGGVTDGRMTFERQAIDLLRAFSRITDPATRGEVLRLVTAMAPRDGRN